MATIPNIPKGPWIDDKGNPTPGFYEFCKVLFQAAGAPNSTLGAGVNSGINKANQALANAAAAQATGNSASQAVTDLGVVVAADGAGTPPSPFSVSINPFNAYGDRLGRGSVTTDAVTATVTGGTGPFTYAWAYVSGDSFTINSPTSATTTYTGSITVLGQSKYGVYRCTVTDTFDASTSSYTAGASISELS